MITLDETRSEIFSRQVDATFVVRGHIIRIFTDKCMGFDRLKQRFKERVLKRYRESKRQRDRERQKERETERERERQKERETEKIR